MLIQEVCNKCQLTKKAIEYYVEQGLVQPDLLDNGYRDFSEQDAKRLEQIAVLRKLGLTISEIQLVLHDRKDEALYAISRQKAVAIDTMQTKQALMLQLAQTHDWTLIRAQLKQLEQKQSILQRLLDVFPGYYGNYIRLHFAPYLNEPITTSEQQQAFETISSFLDHAKLEIPVDLQDYLEEATKNMDEDFAANFSSHLAEAMQDMDAYLVHNQEILEQYMAFKRTVEYRNSPAYKLQALFEAFNQESGYNDVFIPAMKQLSTSYREYHQALSKANQVFMERYPSKEPFHD